MADSASIPDLDQRDSQHICGPGSCSKPGLDEPSQFDLSLADLVFHATITAAAAATDKYENIT